MSWNCFYGWEHTLNQTLSRAWLVLKKRKRCWWGIWGRCHEVNYSSDLQVEQQLLNQTARGEWELLCERHSHFKFVDNLLLSASQWVGCKRKIALYLHFWSSEKVCMTANIPSTYWLKIKIKNLHGTVPHDFIGCSCHLRQSFYTKTQFLSTSFLPSFNPSATRLDISNVLCNWCAWQRLPGATAIQIGIKKKNV